VPEKCIIFLILFTAYRELAISIKVNFGNGKKITWLSITYG
jgi:hypothetical protein